MADGLVVGSFDVGFTVDEKLWVPSLPDNFAYEGKRDLSIEGLQTESTLVLQVLRMLQGASGEAFHWEEEANEFQMLEDVYIQHLSQSGLKILLQPIIKGASSAFRIQESLNKMKVTLLESISLGDAKLSEPTSHSLAACLSAFLQTFRAAANGIETENQNFDGVTLCQLSVWFSSPMNEIQLLENITQRGMPWMYSSFGSGFSSAEKSTHILNTLFEELCMSVRERNRKNAQLLLFLFLSAINPLLTHLDSWLTNGIVQDPAEEFFVCSVDNGQGEPFSHYLRENLSPREEKRSENPTRFQESMALKWNAAAERIRNPERAISGCPAFLLPMCDDILTAGRSVSLMRRFPNQDSLFQGEGAMAEGISPTRKDSDEEFAENELYKEFAASVSCFLKEWDEGNQGMRVDETGDYGWDAGPNSESEKAGECSGSRVKEQEWLRMIIEAKEAIKKALDGDLSLQNCKVDAKEGFRIGSKIEFDEEGSGEDFLMSGDISVERFLSDIYGACGSSEPAIWERGMGPKLCAERTFLERRTVEWNLQSGYNPIGSDQAAHCLADKLTGSKVVNVPEPAVILKECLLPPLQRKIHGIGQKFLSTLFNDWSLIARLSEIKNLFLGGSGDLLRPFFEQVPLDSRSSFWSDVGLINSTFQQCLLASEMSELRDVLSSLQVTPVTVNAQTEPSKSHGSHTEHNTTKNLNRRAAADSSQSEPSSIQPSSLSFPAPSSDNGSPSLNAFSGLQALQFEWEPRWPLNLILTLEDCSAYTKVFQFLLKVGIVKHKLQAINSRILTNRRNRRMRPGHFDLEDHMQRTLRRLALILTHFVSSFLGYFTDHVTVKKWSTFERSLLKSSSLNDILAAHSSFVTAARTFSFVDQDRLSSMICQRVNLILNQAMDFCKIHSAASSEVDKAKLASMDERLTLLDVNVKRNIVYILQILSAKASSGNPFKGFVTVLDHNSFFREKYISTSGGAVGGRQA